MFYIILMRITQCVIISYVTMYIYNIFLQVERVVFVLEIKKKYSAFQTEVFKEN